VSLMRWFTAGLGLALCGVLAHGSDLVGKDPRTGQTPPAVPVPEVKPVEKVKSKPSCGSHGTSVNFLKTPQAAAERALKEEKLVFVLHVSGNFENPKFT
jgi:hypothetical protein